MEPVGPLLCETQKALTGGRPGHLVRLRLGRHATAEGHGQGQRRDCPAHPISLPLLITPVLEVGEEAPPVP